MKRLFTLLALGTLSTCLLINSAWALTPFTQPLGCDPITAKADAGGTIQQNLVHCRWAIHNPGNPPAYVITFRMAYPPPWPGLNYPPVISGVNAPYNLSTVYEPQNHYWATGFIRPPDYYAIAPGITYIDQSFHVIGHCGEVQEVQSNLSWDYDNDGATPNIELGWFNTYVRFPACAPPPPVQLPQCRDGIDNDHDGRVDLADPGCSGPNDDSEQNPTQCQDGVDNDGDGKVDLSDPGCTGVNDDSEFNPAQCEDGIDNDSDGAVDFPADFSCSSGKDNDELLPRAACQDGIDNDGDGKVDSADPGCASKQDNDETDAIIECENVITKSTQEKLDKAAAELAAQAKLAAQRLVTIANQSRVTQKVKRQTKEDADRATKRADQFVADAKALTFKIPSISNSCPTAASSCFSVDNEPTITALRQLYREELAGIKRFIARGSFRLTGTTALRPIIPAAKEAVAEGNATLDTVPSTSTACT